MDNIELNAKKIFLNIQFIITTHSPQVLGELDENYNIYTISNNNELNIARAIKSI